MISITLFARLIILLLLLPFFFLWGGRKRGQMSHLTALLTKEIIVGIWHKLFGPKRVQIARRRHRRRNRRWRN